MRARADELLSTAVVVAGCGWLLLGCEQDHPGKSTGPTPPSTSAAEASRRILDSLSGGKPSALDGVVLGWREVDQSGNAGAREFLAALRRPDHLRLEVRDAEGKAIVCKVAGEDAWVGPAGGPFTEAAPERRASLDRTMLLLGTLLGWDLRTEGDVILETGELVSEATWAPGRPRVRRKLGEKGTVRRLTLGAVAYRTEGEYEGTGGRIPQIAPGAERAGRRFHRFDLDTAFRDAYFRPEPTNEKGVLEFGGETHYLRRPQMVFVPEALELEIADPGTWEERSKRLVALGNELAALGQEPAGLPLYTTGGRLVILFQPEPGKTPRVPPGHAHRKRPGHHALVLSARAPWDDAVRSLAERLRARAKELELKGQGEVRFRPYWLPGEDEIPGRDTVLTVRAELAVR